MLCKREFSTPALVAIAVLLVLSLRGSWRLQKNWIFEVKIICNKKTLHIFLLYISNFLFSSSASFFNCCKDQSYPIFFTLSDLLIQVYLKSGTSQRLVAVSLPDLKLFIVVSTI